MINKFTTVNCPSELKTVNHSLICSVIHISNWVVTCYFNNVRNDKLFLNGKWKYLYLMIFVKYYNFKFKSTVINLMILIIFCPVWRNTEEPSREDNQRRRSCLPQKVLQTGKSLSHHHRQYPARASFWCYCKGKIEQLWYKKNNQDIVR
jgi:hypothetical protein